MQHDINNSVRIFLLISKYIFNLKPSPEVEQVFNEQYGAHFFTKSCCYSFSLALEFYAGIAVLTIQQQEEVNKYNWNSNSK